MKPVCISHHQQQVHWPVSENLCSQLLLVPEQTTFNRLQSAGEIFKSCTAVLHMLAKFGGLPTSESVVYIQDVNSMHRKLYADVSMMSLIDHSCGNCVNAVFPLELRFLDVQIISSSTELQSRPLTL